MTAFQKALRFKPEGFSFVLLSCHGKQISPDELRISEDTHPSPHLGIRQRRNIGYSPQPLWFPFLSKGFESVSPLFCSPPVSRWE
jgi:hypothetical protein